MPPEPREPAEPTVSAEAVPAPVPPEKKPEPVPWWVAQGSRPPQAHR